MTPDMIQACGIAIAAVITAWVGWQGRTLARTTRELKALTRKFTLLEGRFDALEDKYHVSIRHIRDWRWRHQNGDQGPAPLTPPEIAEDL